MSKSAVSVFIFGLYLEVIGVVVMVTPNALLDLLHLPSTNEVWIRGVGMLVLLLGIYYILGVRKGMTDFFRWTVYLRATVIFFFSGFVLLGFVEPPILVIGAIDFLGAIWTGLSLRASKSG